VVIGIAYETLKRYRYVWVKWKDSPVKPKRFALAKALASFKQKDWYIEKWPDETEKQARLDVKRWKKEEKIEAELKGMKRPKLESLKQQFIKACDKFLFGDSKEQHILDKLLRFYTNELPWNDYSDMWDALEAVSARVRVAKNQLDVILRPQFERAPDEDEEPEPDEPGARPELEPEPEIDDREQLMKLIPFRKGEYDDDI
jgi:hypothetical protein